MFVKAELTYIGKDNRKVQLAISCWVILFSFLFQTSSTFSMEKNLRFTHITVEDGLSQNTINGIVKDKYGFMWFATWEGVSKYDGYSFQSFYASAGDTSGLISNRISNIYLDSSDQIWVTDGNGSYSVYNYDQDKFLTVLNDSVSQEVTDGLARSIYRTQGYGNTEWFINEKDSILLATFHDGSTKRYYKTLFDDDGLNDENLTDLFIDDSGIIWVGTESSGVNKADIGAKPFYHYKSIPFNSNSLVDNVVRAVLEDKDGNLWVGTTNKGVTKIDLSGNYSHYTARVNDSISLIDNRVRCLFADFKGDVWIGTRGGLSKFSPVRGTFRSYSKFVPPYLPHNSIYWMMEDHDNVLWIATFNGLARYDRDKDEFVAYQSDSLLNSNKVRCVFEDSRNWLWVGTEGGGISVLERDKDFGQNGQLHKLKEYGYVNNTPSSIPSNVIHQIKEDRDGLMWIGTNKGLCRLNPASNELLSINRETGFPDDLIMGIEFDDKNNIWVSHKKGLTKISFDEKGGMLLRTYTVSDGLQGNEFSHNASEYGAINKRMFFGGSKGLTAFNPDSIQDNLFLPKTLINEIRINNEKVSVNELVNGKILLNESILNTKSIRIDYSVKTLGVGFVGLHYSNPESNQYQYMLEGFDDDWVLVDASHRIASYSNLAPGNYKFKVKSSNCDGIWNPVPASLEIIVLPPWWKTNWAYSGYIALMLLSIGFILHFVRWRERLKHQLLVEKLKKEQVQAINTEKTEFYKLISHELRTPLSLIIDPLEQIYSGNVTKESERSILKMMLQNSKRMKQLLNQLLEFSKIDSELKGDNKEGDLLVSIRQVYNSFIDQAQKRGIQLLYSTSQSHIFCIFDEDKIQKIVTNLLSNAIKYTPDDGIVNLVVKLNQEKELSNVLIEVSDSGIGIPDEEKEQVFNQFYQRKGIKPFKGDSVGLGLSIVKKLVEKLRGSIRIENNHPKGSRFIVDMKVQLITNSLMSDNHEENSELEIHVDKNVADKEKNWVLLVDDNHEIVNYLKDILSPYFNVSTAYDGESALTIAISEVPDLIISDVMMPGMSGMELCQKIKSEKSTSHVPIILLTAKGGEEVQIEAYGKGADIYHEKPFNSKLLMNQIQSLLKGRSVFKEYLTKNTPEEIQKDSVNSAEYEFVKTLIELINENLQNAQFGPDMLADMLAISKRQLYRKVKALTDQTVHEIITGQRMKKAKELLQTKKHNIAEIAFQVGYSEASNFSRTFAKLFGESPSAYQKRIG